MRRTAVANIATTGVAAVVGFVLARWLGPTGRGQYAAVTAFLGVTLTIFELGLTSSTVFFVSRTPDRVDTYVRTARRILLVLSVVAMAVAVVIAALDVAGARTAFLVLLPCILIGYVAAPYVYALQSINLPRWNLVRVSQPVALAVLVAIAVVVAKPDTALVVGLLAVSTAAQALYAFRSYAVISKQRGTVARDEVRPMLRFGLLNLTSSAPNVINGRLDQFVLAFLVTTSHLGQYAVAVTLSLLAAPLVNAFGNVAFPALARGGVAVAETVQHALRGATFVALTTEVVIVAVAPFLITPVFGGAYSDVARLLFLLAPGAVFYAVNQVLGDLLRGLGRPTLVATCEWLGVVGTVVGLSVFAPVFGVVGAAITSSVVYAVVFAGLLRNVLRETRRSHAAGGHHRPAAPAVAPAPRPVTVSRASRRPGRREHRPH